MEWKNASSLEAKRCVPFEKPFGTPLSLMPTEGDAFSLIRSNYVDHYSDRRLLSVPRNDERTEVPLFGCTGNRASKRSAVWGLWEQVKTEMIKTVASVYSRDPCGSLCNENGCVRCDTWTRFLANREAVHKLGSSG